MIATEKFINKLVCYQSGLMELYYIDTQSWYEPSRLVLEEVSAGRQLSKHGLVVLLLGTQNKQQQEPRASVFLQ